MYSCLPPYKVSQLHKGSGNPVGYIYGPDERSSEVTLHDLAAAKAISTYPRYPGSEVKQGEPICDGFCLKLFEDSRALVAIADGCNWGPRPKEAATRAIAAFMSYVEQRLPDIYDMRDAGHFLLRAFDVASREILRGKQYSWEAGTTTLLGGLLLQVDDPASEGPRFVFVCVNVGDCKAFKWSWRTQTTSDITRGNRTNLTDARDPGGCLGPHRDNGAPDLRNLQLYSCDLEPGDLLVFLSDGVHDNMDPQSLGKSPREFGIPSDSWEHAEKTAQEKTESVKRAYQEQLLKQFIAKAFGGDSAAPLTNLIHTLLDYCHDLTQPSRSWMEENPGKLPDDQVAYPGKMDHATVMCYRVPAKVPSEILAAPEPGPPSTAVEEGSDEESPPPSQRPPKEGREDREGKELREHRAHKEHRSQREKRDKDSAPKRTTSEKEGVRTPTADRKKSSSKSDTALYTKSGKQET